MTKIFAHRGSKGTHPENTLPAFLEAILVGADGIELDVQCTSDGVVVVMHDETLERTTNGSGLLKDMTWSEIKKLDADKSKKLKNTKVSVPSLEEVLLLLSEYDYQGILNIEFKTDVYPYLGIEEKVLELIEKSSFSGEYLLSSFNIETLERLIAMKSKYPCGFIVDGDSEFIEKVLKNKKIGSIHPRYSNTKKYLGFSKNIRPWTVNEKKDMLYCFENKIAGFFTDYPKKAIEVRKYG